MLTKTSNLLFRNKKKILLDALFTVHILNEIEQPNEIKNLYFTRYRIMTSIVSGDFFSIFRCESFSNRSALLTQQKGSKVIRLKVIFVQKGRRFSDVLLDF